MRSRYWVLGISRGCHGRAVRWYRISGRWEGTATWEYAEALESNTPAVNSPLRSQEAMVFSCRERDLQEDAADARAATRQFTENHGFLTVYDRVRKGFSLSPTRNA